MEDTKQWYQSSSIIGSIVVLISLIASIFSYDITIPVQGEIVNTALAMSGAIGSAIAIYGRIKATKIIVGKTPVVVESITPSEATTPTVDPSAPINETTASVPVNPLLQPILDSATQAYNLVITDSAQVLSTQTK